MPNLAVFASGNGSNFQTIADHTLNGRIPGDVVLLVTDKPGAYAVERAEGMNIPVLALAPKSFESKQAYEQAILNELHAKDIDFVILAGYMRLIGPTLLSAYSGRILNIHPSLLPSFPGLHAIEQAFEKGVKVTGVTVHYVDEGMDTGPILAQQAVEIDELDTLETLEEKIHAVEHQLYPAVIAKLLNQKLEGARHNDC